MIISFIRGPVFVTVHWHDEEKFNADHCWGFHCKESSHLNLISAELLKGN